MLATADLSTQVRFEDIGAPDAPRVEIMLPVACLPDGWEPCTEMPEISLGTLAIDGSQIRVFYLAGLRFGGDGRQLVYSNQLDVAETADLTAMAAALDRHKPLAAQVLVTRLRRDVLKALPPGVATDDHAEAPPVRFAHVPLADQPVVLSGPADLVSRIVGRITGWPIVIQGSSAMSGCRSQ